MKNTLGGLSWLQGSVHMTEVQSKRPQIPRMEVEGEKKLK